MTLSRKEGRWEGDGMRCQRVMQRASAGQDQDKEVERELCWQSAPYPRGEKRMRRPQGPPRPDPSLGICAGSAARGSCGKGSPTASCMVTQPKGSVFQTPKWLSGRAISRSSLPPECLEKILALVSLARLASNGAPSWCHLTPAIKTLLSRTLVGLLGDPAKDPAAGMILI